MVLSNLPSVSVLAAIAAVVVYPLYTITYNLFVSPLSKIPGPKLWALSPLFYARLVASGNGHRQIQELHAQYGPFVRVGPSKVSVNHPDGMKEVRGHRQGPENPKDAATVKGNKNSVFGADQDDHWFYRRVMAKGFNTETIILQQRIITQYVDTLFRSLRKEAGTGNKAVEIDRWLNYVTFDINGDLAFGESFGCLENKKYHPWIESVLQGTHGDSALPKDKLQKRISLEKERPDFTAAMLSASPEGRKMTFDELVANGTSIVIAGSEKTATLLTAATYYLGTHPKVQARLHKELDEAFTCEEHVTNYGTQSLPYLLAVVEEAARVFPPVPSPSPRVIHQGGDTILGHYLPEGTSVDIWQYAVYHNPAHFKRPDEFIPERWLGDSEFENDARRAVQPFSMGPRNCIGKMLAYAELRLILGRLAYNFEIRVADDTKGWADKTKAFATWEKGPANVYLTPRKNIKVKA